MPQGCPHAKKNCRPFGRQFQKSKLYESALGELGSTTGGLQTVLLKAKSQKALWLKGFWD